jgi:hypothetical protein
MLLIKKNVKLFKRAVMKESKEGSYEQVKNMGGEKYACPDHCEEDKIYDQPGQCPICGNKLQKV